MFKRLSRKNKKILIQIKKHLSTEFKVIRIKKVKSAEKLYSLLTNPKRVLPVMQARINENNEIYIIIKDIYGVYYISKTVDYKWFFNNFLVNQT